MIALHEWRRDTPKLTMVLNDRILSCPHLDLAIDRQPLTVTPQTPLLDVITLMAECASAVHNSNSLLNAAKASCVAIVEGLQLVGLFTQQDVVRLAASGVEFANLKIEDVMNRQAIALTQSDSEDILTALSLLSHHQLEHLPILAVSGQLLGIVTPASICQVLQPANPLSEQKLALHVQQTPLAVIEWNLNFEVTNWNPAAEAIFGYSYIEARGCHAAGLVVPENAKEHVDRVWKDLLTKKGGDRSTNENITKDGQTIICEWYNTSLTDENGIVIGVTSLAQDITERVEAQIALQLAYEELEMRIEERTVALSESNQQLQAEIAERKQAERELRATTSRLTTLIQNIQAGILVKNELKQIVLVNQELCTMMGIPEAAPDLIGSDFSGFAQQKKNCFAEPEEFVHRTEEILLHRQVVTNEELQLADGRTFERDYVPILIEENYSGHLWMYRDITKRKQAEEALLLTRERLQYLLSSSPAVIYSCKTSDNYSTTFMSENVISMLGYNAREHLEDSSFWAKHIHPDDITRILKEFPRIFEKGYHIHEYRFRHKDGTYRWMYDQMKLVQDADGKPVEIVGYWADVTERKQLEEELMLALAKEKELSDLKSRFVTMTSHEFRTPLSTILSSAELLEHYSHKWTPEKKLTHLQRIQTAVKHMTELLHKVLIIGAWQAGTLEFNPAPLDLVQFCGQLVEELQLREVSQHTINFIYHEQEEEDSSCLSSPDELYLDETLLRQILINLLINAIKYSPKGSTVQFTLNCENDRVVFQIRDEGIGIPLKDQSHLFESFHRATNVGNTPGTGLGLAIVKKCVDLHGGQVTLESEVGIGTTFTVILPISALSAQRQVLSKKEEIVQ